MSPGWVGCQPSSSRVSALEAGASSPRKPPIQVKCSPASSGAMETTGSTDKREVLFAGAGALQDLLVDTVAKAPDGLAPIEAAAAGIEAAGAAIQEGGGFPRQRQAIIAASAELQERELIKLASLASALAGALRRRGVTDPAASLAAEAGIAVFRIAFERWVSEPGQPDLPQLIAESMDELKAVTAGR